MLFLDRDGVVIGDPFDFEANHPKYIQRPEDMVIQPQIASLINKEGGAIASNQQGIKWRYKSIQEVAEEMRYLMRNIHGLRLCVFCPDEGHTAWAVSHSELWRISEDFPELKGQFRKPAPGMIQVLKECYPEGRAYVGDLSGLPWYGDGRNSDLVAAAAARIDYIDVRELID